MPLVFLREEQLNKAINFLDERKGTKATFTKWSVEHLKTLLVPVSTPMLIHGQRKQLANKRRGITQKVRIDSHTIYLRTGEFEDGKLGEIFLDMPSIGSGLRGFLQCFAISISIGLQHGVPLEEYYDAYGHYDFEPNGQVHGSENVTTCTSIIDWVFQELQNEYGNNDRN